MKKFLIIPILLSFIISASLTAQNKRVISSEETGVQFMMTEAGLKFYQPSVDGNVLVSDIRSKMSMMGSRLNFTLFPGYPISVTGASTIPTNSMEGAIYCNMDSDADLEIVINIAFNTYAYDYDGNVLPGWPKTITQATIGSPAFGDIDGDGDEEIVIGSQWGTTGGKIYAYEKDGTLMTGFPISHGNATRTPVLGDLNNDGSLEIIMGKRTYPTGQVCVYKGDGTPLAGWPQNISTVPASSAAIGDITGDGVPEVIYEALYSLYAFSASGTLLPGFPFNLPVDTIATSYSSPVLVDLNNDGFREIIFGAHESVGAARGVVYVLKNDGTLYPGWPKYTTMWIYGPPAVGYVDGDNILDIAIGDQVLSMTPADYVYVWNANGQLLPGFPAGPFEAVNSQIILSDIDADGMTELIFDDNTYNSTTGKGKYMAVNHDGTIVSGFPLETMGTTFFMTPVMTDVNLDGTMDMFSTGQTREASQPAISYLQLWNTQVPYNGNTLFVPMFQYNTVHNGNYDERAIIPVELTSFTASVNGNQVVLNWNTASELNNRGFEIEKLSSSEWMKIGFVEGNGTTSEPSAYSYIDNVVQKGKITYRLKQIDFDGTYSYSNTVEVDVNSISEFSLVQNYPNPFNPSTVINYNLPERSNVKLSIMNTLGETVAELVNEIQSEGNHIKVFNALNLSSGIYFAVLNAASASSGKAYNNTIKMIYIK